MHSVPIMCINNGIYNYLSRVAIIPQNQQPELKHVPPKDIWGSILGHLRQALIYHMVSGHVKKENFLFKKKPYEVKAKGLTQIGVFPTLLSTNCSALPHFQNNCDLQDFIC